MSFLGLALPLFLIAADAPTTGPAPQAVLRVNAVGLQVQAPVLLTEEDNAAGVTFGMGTGTGVVLQVVALNSGIVGIAEEHSEEPELVDDTGARLEPEEGVAWPFKWQTVSKNRKVLLFQVNRKSVPQPEAKTLQIRGKLAVYVASRRAKARVERIRLEKDSEIEAGPMRLRIDRVGRKMFGSGDCVQFASRQDLAALAGITVYEPGGDKLGSGPGAPGKSTLGIGALSSTVWFRSLDMNRMVPVADLEIDYWQDLERVEVPIDLTIGLGLGSRTATRPE